MPLYDQTGSFVFIPLSYFRVRLLFLLRSAITSCNGVVMSLEGTVTHVCIVCGRKDPKSQAAS